MAGFLPVLSAIFGWVYFLCWSASFYPQAFLNWRRRSTSGTTVDFPFINCLGRLPLLPLPPLPHVSCVTDTDGQTAGFAAYFASNAAFLYSPTIRAQYAARNKGLTPTVQFNDVTFALHGLVLSVVTTTQYLLARPLWRFATPSLGTRPSRFILGIGSGCLLGVLGTSAIVLASAGPRRMDFDPAADWCALDIIYAVGYVKVVVTLVKYTPQILANWRNGSTRGWSIWQILLDFAGGILSVGQQGIDSYLQRDWSGITGNPVKFALGNVSMVYDVIFMVQHYVLYGEGKAGKGEEGQEEPSEEDGLLQRDEEGRVR